MAVPACADAEDGRAVGEAAVGDGEERLAAALARLDVLLGAAPFLTGRAFGLADVAYVPWLLRLRDLMGVSLQEYRAVVRWLDTCCERPSVAAEVETVASLAA